MCGALGVGLDGLELVALDDRAYVEASERRRPGRATLLRLLMQPLLGLGREVGRVELGVGGEDRLHVLAERGVVDLLDHRDEFGTCGLDRECDLDVVGEVPGQPVDLVDDHVVEIALSPEPREERLQLGPESRRRTAPHR